MNYNTIKYTFLLFILAGTAQAQTYKDKNAPVEARVNSLLSQMTLDEKIDYIGGGNFLDIKPIPRLGLPRIDMSDGPVGVNEYGPTTAYPCGILDAATWDTAMVHRVGTALGRDARARGVHILLAPGVNIYRAPMCGRNFEYFGEDPYLASRMAVSYIEGLQSQGVVATVKHFAANNQEWDRHNVSSDMDDRTLQEIYLPAFKAAIQEAKVGAVMDSYNLVNSVHATQNAKLNIDILRKDWGFDGILMSDWGATYDGVFAAQNGLDLEMPYGRFMNRETLLPAIKGGEFDEALIDEKVRHILRIIFRFGFYDRPQQDTSIPKDDPQNVQTALAAAREGIVLLKNENHALPLQAGRTRHILVLGPNAEGYVGGGGSSEVWTFHATSLLDGLKQQAPKAAVTYLPVLCSLDGYARHSVFYTAPGSAEPGLKAEYFKGRLVKETPDSSGIEQFIIRKNEPLRQMHQLPDGPFIGRWTGVIRPEHTGNYAFTVRCHEDFSLDVAGNPALFKDGEEDGAHTATLHLDSGREYPIRLEYTCAKYRPQLAFAWYPAIPDLGPAIAAAKKSDAVVLAMGYNDHLESESGDRSFELPAFQDSLIRAISRVNPKTIVVLNSGGNVSMQKWLPGLPALLQAWYPGQEGGTAVADILFGKVNPSGKLPATFEKAWQDAPAYESYYDQNNSKHVAYKEGLFIGYRYWDTTQKQPAFPFGYGLSYTRFAYSSLTLSQTGGKVAATFTITNTGSRDGAEVAELYVHEQQPKGTRPFKELKGFTRVFIKKGESKTVTIQLDRSAFAWYHEDRKAFAYDPGQFDLLVGASSKDIRLKGSVQL